MHLPEVQLHRIFSTTEHLFKGAAKFSLSAQTYKLWFLFQRKQMTALCMNLHLESRGALELAPISGAACSYSTRYNRRLLKKCNCMRLWRCLILGNAFRRTGGPTFH